LASALYMLWLGLSNLNKKISKPLLQNILLFCYNKEHIYLEENIYVQR
jgi:hypothetical protein